LGRRCCCVGEGFGGGELVKHQAGGFFWGGGEDDFVAGGNFWAGRGVKGWVNDVLSRMEKP